MSEGAQRIEEAFAAARDEGRAALMPYMLAGYPDQSSALEVGRAYVESGADLVEVGVPFSDPLADGPVIHEAATKALAAGAGLDDGLAVVEEISGSVPAILMCYVNMVLARGVERFAEEARSAGAAGVLMPDLPYRESPELEEAIRDRGIAPISLIAPTTTRERTKQVCETAEGFIYLVSTVGTTGVRGEMAAGLAGLVDSVREVCDVPVAIGFGVGSPDQAEAVGRLADGVIIGSRLVEMAGRDNGAGRGEISEFLSAVGSALRRSPS